MRVIYQFLNIAVTSNVDLRSKVVNGNQIGNLETVHSETFIDFSAVAGQFSALADGDYGTHVVYRSVNGKVGYAYRPASGTEWASEIDILSGSYPTITIDHSTKDLYLFARILISVASCISMVRKPLSQTWAEQGLVGQYYCSLSPVSHMSSNSASVGGTNSSWVSLVWTEGSVAPFQVKYMGIPIPSAWSPYSSPSNPWDGNGVVPNGEYFANHGEYVSPSSGMLAVRHTDLSIPGRGLGLEIARTYVEPPLFTGGSAPSPWLYESFPWAHG